MDLKAHLAKLPKETLEEVQRQAELYLAAQLQAGIAADSRAVSFVSLMAAATVALSGGGVALLLGDKPSLRLGITAIASAVGFIISMGCAFKSARPVDFEYAGGRPEDWVPDAESGKPYVESLAEQLEIYNARSGANSQVLNNNASWMQASLWIAIGTIVIGFVLTTGFLIAGRH